MSNIDKPIAQAGERENTVSVITGGARGFGKAFGQALVRLGAITILIDRDASALEETASQLGPLAFPYPGDVTDEAAMQAIMNDVANKHGGIDILINNAGLHSHEYSRPIADMGVDKVRRLFDVNVMGTVICTLSAHPFMQTRANASIINIASSAAFQGGAYGNSKLAVIGLTMTFARELAADKIRVNAIAPGIILTDTIREELAPETHARIKAMQYLDSDGSETDVVEAMLYLTSDKARFITGETLRVTGGFAAGV